MSSSSLYDIYAFCQNPTHPTPTPVNPSAEPEMSILNSVKSFFYFFKNENSYCIFCSIQISNKIKVLIICLNLLQSTYSFLLNMDNLINN